MSLHSSTSWQRAWIAVFLLLVLTELSTSLLLFTSEFIRSDQILVSPFRVCWAHGNNNTFGSLQNDDCWLQNDFGTSVVIICLYTPLVLVAFGLLALVFAFHAEDRALMRLSALCQGASSLLLLVGIVGFLQLSGTFVTWGGLTCWFYACVCAQVELVITTALTNRAVKSDKSVDMTVV